jgi:hypothetical protein
MYGSLRDQSKVPENERAAPFSLLTSSKVIGPLWTPGKRGKIIRNLGSSVTPPLSDRFCGTSYLRWRTWSALICTTHAPSVFLVELACARDDYDAWALVRDA